MTDHSKDLTDTRDMLGVHRALDRALREAPSQVAAVEDADLESARRLAAYLEDVMWLLHVHHVGEDELLYPLLAERAPEAASLCARMEEQHGDIAASVAAIDDAIKGFGASAAARDGAGLSALLLSMADTLAEHLAEEETDVLPLAAVHLSPEEWGALPGHAMSRYQGERIWLILGLVLESMEEPVRAATLSHFPPPVLEMWNGVGSAAYDEEMAFVRNGTSRGVA
jgi:hemerythrin-like domain-containing protein